MAKLIQINYQETEYSFNEDGWFNATIAAQKFGKRPAEWLRLPETEKYIAALCRRAEVGKSHFVKTRRGGDLSTQGTWLHPKLAVRFMQWLDVDVAIWCDEQIDSIIRNGTGDVNYLPLFLRENMTEWELRFKPEYYHALAKATNTRYDGHVGGTPALYGQITERWVYGIILPEEVHSELRERKGKSEKMHQWLTDGGRDVLDKQIQRVTDIAGSSANIRDFEARMRQITGKKGQQGIIYPQELRIV